MAAAAAAGESDSSSSKPNSPKWAMLDRYVFKSFDLDACGDGTTSPECRTGQGVPFRISLRLSTTPAVSRLYLHMPTGAAETHCRILASHRDALLLSMYEPLTEPVDGQDMPRFYDQELFVYIAGSTPSLTLLPACTRSPQEVRDDDHAESFASDDAESFASDGANSVASDGPYSFASDGPYSFASDGASSLASDGADSVKLDHGDGQLENIAPAKDGYDPLALITQFELHAVGIQCNDTGDYAVAYLCVSRCLTPGSGAEVVEAQLCVYHSSKSTWELHARPIPYHDDKELSELTRWSTNRITTFGTYLCWIDYNCGILFCDLFAKRLNVTYISLPVEACRCPEACMDMYRNVCVVQDRDGSNKKMKFVDVSPHHGYYFRPPPSSRFELNIWTLVTDEGDGSMSWTHEFMIQDHELRISDLVPSPHGPLTFPVMSIEEPDVAYFAVGPYGYFVKNMWIVPVDLNGRSAKCAFPYLKGEEDLLGDDADMARTKAHCFEPFLPCDINLFFPQATGDMTALRNAPVLLPSCVEGEGFKTSARKEGPILPWAYSNAQEVNVRRLHSKASIECAQNTATQIVCPQCATRFVQANVFSKFHLDSSALSILLGV